MFALSRDAQAHGLRMLRPQKEGQKGRLVESYKIQNHAAKTLGLGSGVSFRSNGLILSDLDNLDCTWHHITGLTIKNLCVRDTSPIRMIQFKEASPEGWK